MMLSCPALEVRALTVADRELLAAVHAHTSPESLYLRFHGPKPVLSDRDLNYLCDVDGFDHVAFVAVDPGHDGRIAGICRAFRTGPGQAEIAVLVTDDYQGHGVGRSLCRTLLAYAAQIGIRQVTADILATNTPAIKLIAGLRPGTRIDRHGSSVQLTVVV